ncbi:MAG TPA: serine/threonine-protein kinase, partial [Bryobacteraceae bacterium]|nr:serine/threonine-protein kinase [Bryobacteraceae bacterium]
MPLNRNEPSPEQIELIFQQAFDLAAEDRADFVKSACSGDAQLLKAVETLLEAAGRSERNPVWEEPALYNEARFVDEQFHTGMEVDRYRLLERIGAGGMGTVYRAVRSDDQYSKIVAIKLCESWDSATIERLRQERQILAGLEHPYIARLLDGGATREGVPFLAMEYVEGVPIDRYVSERKLPQREILELFEKICAAVSYAHRNLIVHRDLKPANILVTSQGEPKLLDFGIAKLLDGSSPRTVTGIAPMTPEYASPEQIRGAAITTATDIYSLGILLYELLSGARPYSVTGNPLGLADAIVNQPPLPLRERMGRRSDPDLENITGMALRKEPERRYASVDQFSEDIRRYLAGYPVAARSPSGAYKLRKFIGRNRGAVIASSLLLIALLAGIAATLYQAHIANDRFNDVRQLAHSVIFDYHDAIEPLPGSTPVRQKLVQDALVYLDKLSRQKTDASLKRELVEGYVKIADVQGNAYESNLGDSVGALSSAARAVGLGEELVKADRSVASRGTLASAYVTRADLLAGTNRLNEAAQDYRSAIALGDGVVR